MEWRNGDKFIPVQMDQFIRHFLSLSGDGRKELARAVSAAAGYGHDEEDDSPPEQAATPDNAVVQNPDQGNIFPSQKPE